VVTAGPATWHCVAPAAKGLHQSPVNITPSDVIYDAQLTSRPLSVHYDAACCSTLVNNGHSLQAVVNAHDTCQLRVTSPPPREGAMRSVVTSMSVCLSVCLLAQISRYPHDQTSRFAKFFCTLPVPMALFSSDDVAIRYVFPVFWITSRFHIVASGE